MQCKHTDTNSLDLYGDKHTDAHKTSDLCRGLSHISHFSQCCNCDLFPSGLTHPTTSINRPSRSVFVCRCVYMCVHVCSNWPDRAVFNPANQCAVFQLASRACSVSAVVRLLSKSAANPLLTDQCREREERWRVRRGDARLHV